MWKNMAVLGRLQMTIWRIPIACWVPKATNSHSKYAILIAFPLQQQLHECASMLRYTYIACVLISSARTSQTTHCLSHPAYFALLNVITIVWLSHTGLLHRVDYHQRDRCSFRYCYYCHVRKGGFRNSKQQAWERVVIKGPEVSLGPRHGRRKSVVPLIVAMFSCINWPLFADGNECWLWLHWEVELISSLSRSAPSSPYQTATGFCRMLWGGLARLGLLISVRPSVRPFPCSLPEFPKTIFPRHSVNYVGPLW